MSVTLNKSEDIEYALEIIGYVGAVVCCLMIYPLVYNVYRTKYNKYFFSFQNFFNLFSHYYTDIDHPLVLHGGL